MLPPVVDCHIHFRDPDNNPYELQPEVGADGERGGVRATEYLPDAYFDDARVVDLVGIVHVEAQWSASDPVGETRWIHALAAENRLGGLPFAVVGFANLGNDDVERVLEAHGSYPRTRTIRHMLNRVEGRPDLCWADREFLEDATWQRNYALLARYGLAFDAMCFGHQMPALAALAARHPDIPVHLEHAGLPWDHTEEGRTIWRAGMKALAALPNADVKISGLGNTVPDWTIGSIRPYVLETIDIFGPDRVAFASNFPTDKAFSDMRTLWEAFDEITLAFSHDERTAMFATNAQRIYSL